jgi:hypothetical protein
MGPTGQPILYNETEPVPADEHHRIAVRNEKAANRLYPYTWDGDELGRNPCMKVVVLV